MINLTFLIIALPVILISITIHEFAHGKAADVLGDPTPRLSGRLTLNPISHIDPIGFLMLILFRFGWAKPVPINPYYFRDPKRDMALVSMAGPASNLFFAWLLAQIIKFTSHYVLINPEIFIILQYVIWLNIALAVFNLLPIPPLDGSNILQAFLPNDNLMPDLQRYGFFILLGFIFLGGFRLIQVIVNYIYGWFM